MKFGSASNVKRPIRLSATTRKWAWESLHGKYGKEAMQTPFLSIDDEDFLQYAHIDKYDMMIQKIAKEAPLRICEEERISGSATLGSAIFHVVPVYHQEKAVFSSVSHLTLDYATTLRYGLGFYEKKIAERLKDEALSEKQIRFLQSLSNTMDCLRVYHSRYLQATKEVKPEIYENLLQVPFQPARNFHEAVQSIWFLFSFVRLCGNWPGIGRIDWLLGDYLKRDLETGVLTKKQAREILASFFIKGTEWIDGNIANVRSGDAQHYQNIVLAGVDENGVEVTNEVTYLVLDIIEELGISDFPITVRISQKTSEKLLNKVARVIRHGGGTVAIYNEDLILKALTDFGYPLKEARSFANDGCWEVQVPGKTRFGYLAFDSLALLQNQTLQGYNDIDFSSFEELYAQYLVDLEKHVQLQVQATQDIYSAEPLGLGWSVSSLLPTSVISLFENACIENALSYYDGGTIYNVRSPHIGGIADTVNSLYAIKKLVFEERKLSFAEFMTVLRNNWQGSEHLRAYVSSYPYYGCDHEEVDEIYARLLQDFYLICKKLDDQRLYGFRYPAGVSTFGREIDWLPNRLATPEGTTIGTVLAGNASPTPGTDTEGITAVIKSYCKADLSKMVTGTALDLKISPTSIQGNNGLVALKQLIRSFVRLGGYFMQLDCVSAETLKKAQENPQDYKTLSVRVSGWNARFITLTKEWQDMVIQRTEHHG